MCFIGRTGSGKSSILNCLFKLYEIDEGEIMFKGNNTKNQISIQTIRKSIVIY